MLEEAGAGVGIVVLSGSLCFGTFKLATFCSHMSPPLAHLCVFLQEWNGTTRRFEGTG